LKKVDEEFDFCEFDWSEDPCPMDISRSPSPPQKANRMDSPHPFRSPPESSSASDSSASMTSSESLDSASGSADLTDPTRSYACFASRKSRIEEEREIEEKITKYKNERKKQIENSKKLILTPKGPKWIVTDDSFQ